MEQIKRIDALKQETSSTKFQVVKSTNFFFKYKWHFVFWIVYFIYSFGTDKIMMGDGMTFTLEVILISTHHVFLFYSFLYCLRRFSLKDIKAIAISASRILLVIITFLSVRIYLNSSFFPWLYKIDGKVYQPLGTVEMNIKATFYLIEFFIKSLAFFYIFKFAAEQRQLRLALIDNYEQKIALEANIVKAEKAEQVKLEYSRLETTFINLVHETKTPLTIANNCISEHITKYGSSPELELGIKSLNKLGKDISNLFDIERFKKGKQIYQNDQICNVSEILTDNIALYAFHAKRKNIEINTSISENLYSFADPSAINRIANNLLENALRYSNENTNIKVELSSDSNNVFFKIEDQGIGIEDEDLDKIFIPYQQLNKNKSNTQGLGIGLPLVKSIIEDLHGEIQIINKKPDNETGIIVQITLKRAISNGQVPEFKVPEDGLIVDEPITLSNIFIGDQFPDLLIVEDNKELGSYILSKLGQEFNVKFALNGQEAIQSLKNGIPDLIISDVMMDVMDGFEMAKIISENPSYNHIPIIFLTARNSEKDKLNGFALGAVDYVEKPFSLEILLHKITSILSHREIRDQKLFNAAYRSMKSLIKTPEFVNNELPADHFEANCRNYELTKTQQEIARLIIDGKSIKEIAEIRFISEGTADTHRKNIYTKVQVSSKLELHKKLNTSTLSAG